MKPISVAQVLGGLLTGIMIAVMGGFVMYRFLFTVGGAYYVQDLYLVFWLIPALFILYPLGAAIGVYFTGKLFGQRESFWLVCLGSFLSVVVWIMAPAIFHGSLIVVATKRHLVSSLVGQTGWPWLTFLEGVPGVLVTFFLINFFYVILAPVLATMGFHLRTIIKE